jgi:hypothetical protein
MENIKFQHIVGILVLLMFGGLAYKFGATWSPLVWGLLITALLIFALALVAPDVALNLVKALPGIVGKVPAMVGKVPAMVGKVKDVIPFIKKSDKPEEPK